MAKAAISAAAWLRDASAALAPAGPVRTVYHPLTYAWAAHEAYLQRYAQGRKRALMVGMNPGPWGMGQVGIPFGDVPLVGDWLGLRGTVVEQPSQVHPKRPVQGWACTRREQSGKRLWGFLQEAFGTGDAALKDLAIANHCPLLLFGSTGTNITPDKLPKADRETVYAVCDEGLRRMIDAVAPKVLIGVGGYAEARCSEVAANTGAEVLRILHPSPASPLANKDGGQFWRDNVRETLIEAGIMRA